MVGFAEKLIAPKIDFVVYLTSTENNIPTYFYVAINGANFRKFRTQLAADKIDLKACGGVILESGYGSPSFALKEYMLKTYGCRSDVAISLK